MEEFISNLIGNHYISTFIMSLVPLIELKGGIIFAWDRLGPLLSFVFAYLGSTIVFIPIYFLLRPLLNLLKKIKIFNNFANKVEHYFTNKAENTLKEREAKHKGKPLNQNVLKQLGVFIFVAIPLPMTGVWTGTGIAVFLNLKFKDVILPVVVGNFIAGLLICALSALCKLIGISLNLVLYILLAMALIFLVVFIIKVSLKKTDNN